MYPKQHIILGGIFSALILLIWPSVGFINVLIIFLSSVLIDIDHYLYYVFKKRDWSLSKACRLFENEEEKLKKLSFNAKLNHKIIPVVFHGVEFMGILILLSFSSEIFFFVLIGFIFHMFLDYAVIIRYHYPLYIKFSQIYLMARNRKRFHNK
jgi:hypothetical protein